MGIIIKSFAAVGLAFVLTIMLGIYLDVKDFGKTKGGYEPPYVGVTGESIDWSRLDITSTGLAKRGYVINVLVNGTTGMISFEIFKQKIDSGFLKKVKWILMQKSSNMRRKSLKVIFSEHKSFSPRVIGFIMTQIALRIHS